MCDNLKGKGHWGNKIFVAMTLPVSSYEELLARVRSLTTETIQLRREITSSLSDCPVLGSVALPTDIANEYHMKKRAAFLERTSTGEELNTANASDFGGSLERPVRPTLLLDKKENENDNERKEIDEKLTSPDTPVGKNYFHRNGWAPDALGLWRSGPSSLNLDQSCNYYTPHQDLTTSVTYNSNEPQSLNTFLSSSKRIYSHQQLGAKVEMVYSLLSMLDMNNREDMSKTFLAMSSSPESCHAMRQSGCLPLLIQLIHSSELNRDVRKRAAEALHNIVHSQTDEKRRKREIRVLKLLQQVREYCNELKNNCTQELQAEPEKHPINAIGTLMKFSFDAEHRQAICILGGLHAISELIQIDYEVHGSTTGESPCITLRRYAGMSLTNLTFGDCKNKALLCSFNKFMCALVDQLKSPCEDLRQVTASVLRNLSWRADSESKQALRDVGAVTALTVSAMEGKKESTLKSILSALWNLSAHCSSNKIDICSVPGSLAFLVKMLRYKSSSNTLSIIENAGGILRNISSHVAVREEYRQILRENNCFEILLEQLKSPSLTIVSNACGTLWNLSARCAEDQRRLWEMGATSMLRSLVQSKHKMIAMGSSAALKNLLAANPNENLLTHLDSTAKNLGLQTLPTLFVRKKRALEQELNITLAETCENIDSIESPTHLNGKTETNKNSPRRSESRDSVQSTQSDSTYERLNQISLQNDEKLIENKMVTLHDSLDEKSTPRKLEDQKLIRRYKSSMIPTPTFKKVNQDRINEKTKEENTQETIGNETGAKIDFSENPNRDPTTERNGNEIPGPNARSLKNRKYQDSHDQCSSLNNDRLVKSTESQPPEMAENVQNGGFNTIPHEKPKTSELNRGRNRNAQRDCNARNNGYNKIDGESRIEKRNLGKSKYEGSNKYPTSVLNFENDTNSPDCYASVVFDENSNEKITANDSSEDHRRINRRVRNVQKAGVNHVTSETRKKGTEKASEDQVPPEGDFSPNDFSDCNPRHFFQGTLVVVRPAFCNSEDCSEDTLDEFPADDSNEIINMEEDESGFLSEKYSQNVELDDWNETGSYDANVYHQQNRFESSGEASHIPFDESPSLQNFQMTSISSQNIQDQECQHEKMVPGATNGKTKEPDSTYSSFDSNVTEITVAKPTENATAFHSTGNRPESTVRATDNVGNVEGVHLKPTNNVVLPKFKVGSPITDSKVLQMEANKICREIKRHQDFEMGCSLTSEVSLISCSSFIDTGDYSLFDSSTDAVDFEDAENFDFVKVSSKLKNLPPRKPITSQAAEPVSLPSLGSLKNEHVEALDLDSSILSVASITSEIAETYSKDPEAFQTYTKTYKVEAPNEPFEDTLADATLVSNGDDTLNADSLQYNPELYDEDNSLHCQENLPLDTEDVVESPADRIKKKLTPKEKRKTFHERYRTYTIRDFNGCKSSEISPAVQDYPSDVMNKDEGNCAQWDNRVPNIKTNEGKSEPRAFSEGVKNNTNFLSKEITEVQDLESGILKELLNIGPAERKELVDNAKLVAFSLKTAVQEPEIISDSETEEPHLDFDTATYSKNFRQRHPVVASSQEVECFQDYEEPAEEEEDVEKKGARISKPNEKFDGKVEEPPKGIRGRRKPLYSSPQKQFLRNSSPMSAPRVSQTVKSSSDTCVPPTLNREGTFTKENGTNVKKPDVKNTRTIPVFCRNDESKTCGKPVSGSKSGVLQRNPKRIGETQVSKIGRPQSACNPKFNERRSESDFGQRRSFSTDSGSRTGGDSATTAKKPMALNSSPKMKNSSSNQSIKGGNSPGSGIAKSKNLTSQNLKSQSDASLNLVASKDKGKPKTPKKEVTSKIASLWRKVEETKQKNKTAKDNRVWISSEKNAGITDEVLVVEQEEILEIPTQRIVHSVTCHALTGELSTDYPSQGRNSRLVQDFSKFGDAEEKTERRSVISAVVPPYNYSPPVSEKTTSLKMKQADGFHKGSLKITTV